MKLLDEGKALIEIRSLFGEANEARIAVAFWGAGAVERLGLDRPGFSAQILCNLDSGACNPAELRRMSKLPGIMLRAHPALHAKVYWTPRAAVLGSSNASSNGLALEGDAAGAWAEANLLVNDTAMLAEMAAWFEKLFAAGYEIVDADIDRAELIWKARSKMAPTGKRLSGDLVTAYRDAPGHAVWKQVKLAYWKDPLSAAEEKRLATEKRDHSLASTTSAYGGWNDRIAANDWVLDFGLSGKSPSFGGVWKALPEDASLPDMRLVYRVQKLRFPGLGSLTLKKADAESLAAIALTVLANHSNDGGRNAVVDLTTAMGLWDLSREAPSEKEFTRAMEQIYTEATKLGYRPIAFRAMVAEHGGVETARRLIRGSATSGFEALWEIKRLDLSVEALILNPKWLSLFSPDELKMARKRLRAYGYEGVVGSA